MTPPPLRYALIGDGHSPHLAKWARALAPRVELWVASSTGLSAALAACVPIERCLVLNTRPDAAGGNIGLLRQLPALGRWLARVDADWINAHYLSSHGSLAWAAQRLWRLRGRLLASAWGSDVLVTPQRHAAYRWALRRVLGGAALATSDSQHMAQRMAEFGAPELMVFPFGLEALPPLPPPKQPWLFFANRALEPIYQPERVLSRFADIAAQQPQAQLVVANEGSLRPALEQSVRDQGLADRVRFVGRLGAAAQALWYQQAQWYVSLPASDSVSVSVIEAMAQGCLPILSDLPANRELVRHADNGWLVGDARDQALPMAALQALADRAAPVQARNRQWVAEHALFGPCIERLLARLQTIASAPGQAPGQAHGASPQRLP